MPTPHHLLSTTTKKSAVPTATKNVFDPWNSSSTGHQRADHPTYSQTTGWRQTRTEKLARQFGGDRGRNAKGVASSSGGGGLQSGEWRWLSAEETKRKDLGCEDIRKYMGGQRKKRKIEEITEMANSEKSNKRLSSLSSIRPDNDHRKERNEEKEKPATTTTASTDQPTTSHRDNKDKDKTTSNSNGIFSGLSIYINGSTAPLISDHRLKQLLVENGANISIALGRRTVTHVILGKPNVNNSSSGTRSKNDDGEDAMNINKYRGIGGAGAGGGLAAGKLQREIQRIGGKGVIYVDVEWVLESLKAAKRLPEARFATLHMASRNQPSVYGMFWTGS